MTPQEAIETIKIAIAEVEWNYDISYAVAFEKAIEALEKLIPKKPTPLVNIYPPNQHECPVCGCGLRVNEKWKDKYCCNCGLFLDWSEIK